MDEQLADMLSYLGIDPATIGTGKMAIGIGRPPRENNDTKH